MMTPAIEALIQRYGRAAYNAARGTFNPPLSVYEQHFREFAAEVKRLALAEKDG